MVEARSREVYDISQFGRRQEGDLDFRVPPDAPTVHIRGIAYRGTIEVSTRPRAEIRRP